MQRRFSEKDFSPATLDLLANLLRLKRVLRKTLSGNVLREFRLHQMLGRDTRWLDNNAGWRTCKTLASL